MSDEFYAGIAGGFMALLGVLLTLVFSQRQFLENLRQERRKNKEDREYAAKQAALSQAAVAIARFIQHYTSIPDREMPSAGNSPAELADLGVSINALHFYCGLETIKKTTEVVASFSSAYADAMTAKLPSSFILGDIRAIDTRIAGLDRMNAATREEIAALLQNDPQNQLIAAHRKHLSTNYQQIAELHGKKADLTKQMYWEAEKCRDVVIKALPSVNAGLTALLVLARNELEIDMNEQEYVAFMSRQAEQAAQFSSKIVSEVRAEMKKRLE